MKFKHKIFFLSILSLVLTSCALHAPLSEELIFDDELQETTDFISMIRSSEIRMSITKSFYSETFENLNRERYAVNVDTTFNPFLQIGLSGYSFLLVFGDKLSIGINPSLLLNAGVDFTYEVSNNLFVTGVGNLAKNAEVIVQSKIIDGKSFKGSIGFNFRHERQGYKNFIAGNEADPFDVNMIGLRGVIYFPLLRHNYRVQFGCSYDMKHRTPIYNIGLSSTLKF